MYDFIYTTNNFGTHFIKTGAASTLGNTKSVFYSLYNIFYLFIYEPNTLLICLFVKTN